ncbi:hypothetical protein HGP16_01745 [Rhizobium sp. P40RR-XXII]|uniref:hypothetical protein n=1 Tax=unclassified Rhizobium TaxID=2613769 RepID=UPI00145663B9|nr:MULTISPECIES: hypothetical protein [unclassified Rhizobium]NLR84077.1 hypothetical protein [Rhizobium sp. P28RR-XV]NLS15277.1 hypothetical protein [Rhizobium sp. P40RR-XXII]
MTQASGDATSTVDLCDPLRELEGWEAISGKVRSGFPGIARQQRDRDPVKSCTALSNTITSQIKFDKGVIQ